MKKISMLLFVAITFFISANTVFAHTHLDTSNPEDGSTVTESIDTIEIYFDTVIEQSAAVEVENSEGQTFPTNDISITDGEMIVTLEEPLENGSYTITWDIIGVDGHPMQESISFDVDAEEIVEEEEVQEESETEEQPATEEDESSEDTEAAPETETSDETTQDTDESSSAVLIAILLVGIIAVIAIVLLKRKK